MTRASEAREYTVLVMGEAGVEPRRFQIRRSTITACIVMLVALPCVAAVVGYDIGRSHGHATTASARAVHAADARHAPERALPSQPEAPAPEPVQVATSEQAPEAPAADEAEPAAADEAEPLGDVALRVLARSGAETVEVHPFSAGGAPSANAFDELAALMACTDGTQQAPTPALVRMLVRAQQAFDRPVMVLGGRCSAHGDREDARQHHRAGRAVDVRLRGVSTKRLTDWLVEQGAGGVGRYGKRGFVHLDLRDGHPEQWEEQPQAQAAATAAPRAPVRQRAAPQADEATPKDVADETEAKTVAREATGAAKAELAKAPAPDTPLPPDEDPAP